MLRACPALLGCALFLSGNPAIAETTMGLILNTGAAFDGYTLFGASAWFRTYLIDNQGQMVHEWINTGGAFATGYLLENGHLVRTANSGDPWFQIPGVRGKIQEVDWDGNLVWEYVYSDSTHRIHHDIAPMPDGNVLAIAYEYKSVAEAVAAGRNPALLSGGKLYPDHVIEVQPIGPDSGAVVWEWHVWDHLVQDFDATKANYGVVQDHPELIDINYLGNSGSGPDWNHMNSVDYNAELDQIVLSVNIFNEFWVIDHSTTTAEAAGHTGGLQGKGGDILYRWGNPAACRRGLPADRNNYRNHQVEWIKPGLPGEGRILFFNNGNGRPEGAYSSIEEVATAVDSLGGYADPPPGEPYPPDSATWIWTCTPPESVYSPHGSGVHRLPNGGSLLCESISGSFWEIDAAGNVVWMYVNPVNDNGPMVQGTIPTVNGVFRTTRYGADYPAFIGRDLTPQGPIELPPAGTGAVEEPDRRSVFALRQNHPNPVRRSTTIPFSLRSRARVKLDVYDIAGRHVATLADGYLEPGEHRQEWNACEVTSGIYTYRIRVDSRTAARAMVVLR